MMARKYNFLSLFVLLCLVGCFDAEVSRATTGDQKESVKILGCSHAGYCATLMPGFDGSMKYKFKMSPYCPGTQEWRVMVTPMRSTYESGRITDWELVEKIEAIGTCQ